MEVAAQMCPAGRLAEPGGAVRAGVVELGIALVAVGLQDAAALAQVLADVLFLPVRSEAVDGAWRCRPRPWPLVADISPDPALLHALAEAPVAQGPVQHPDRCVVGVQQVAGHD